MASRVPNEVTPRTSPSRESMGYLSDAGIEGAAAAWRGVGASISALGLSIERQKEIADATTLEQQRFQAQIGLSNLETSAAQKMTELARARPENDANFYDRASATFENQFSEYLNGLPPELRQEFEVRGQPIRQSFLASAFETHLTGQDTFYRLGITQLYDQAKVSIDNDPSPENLAAWGVKLGDAIAASGLSEPEKAEQARIVDEGLAIVHYTSSLREGLVEGTDIGVGGAGPDTLDSIMDRIAGPVNNPGGVEGTTQPRLADGSLASSANGYGQFLEDTWLQNLKEIEPDLFVTNTVQQLLDMRHNVPLARRVLAHFTTKNMNTLIAAGFTPTAANVYLAHFLGAEGALEILRADPAARAGPIVGPDKVRANPTIFKADTTVADIREWAADKMGTPNLDANPIYDTIPYETRLELRATAEAQAASRLADLQAMQEEQRKAVIDQALLDIHDGKYVNIDGLRQTQNLTFDEVKKLDTAVEQYQGDAMAAQFVSQRVASGSPLNDADPRVNRGLDHMIDYDRIQQGDTEYADSVVNLVGRTHVITPMLEGAIRGLVRSSNPTAWQYGMELLTKLLDASPEETRSAFNEDELASLRRYSYLTSTSRSPQDIYNQLHRYPPGSPEARAADERHTQALQEFDSGDVITLENVQTLFRDALLPFTITGEGFQSTTPSFGALPIIPDMAWNDLREFYAQEFAYGTSGDGPAALILARDRLMERWGVTGVGGQTGIVPYPVEENTPTIANSHDYIADQVWEQFGFDSTVFQLPHSDEVVISNILSGVPIFRGLYNMWNSLRGVAIPRFQLIADRRTQYEINQPRVQHAAPGNRGEPDLPFRETTTHPSWQVVIDRADGRGFVLQVDDAGQPIRFSPWPTQAELTRDEQYWTQQNAEEVARRARGYEELGRQLERRTGQPVPEDVMTPWPENTIPSISPPPGPFAPQLSPGTMLTDPDGFPYDPSRPIVRLRDGGNATEYTQTIKSGDRWFNIPTVWDGRVITDGTFVERAMQEAGRLGIPPSQLYPNFATQEEAEAAAQRRSDWISTVRKDELAAPTPKRRASRKDGEVVNAGFISDVLEGIGGWLQGLTGGGTPAQASVPRRVEDIPINDMEGFTSSFQRGGDARTPDTEDMMVRARMRQNTDTRGNPIDPTLQEDWPFKDHIPPAVEEFLIQMNGPVAYRNLQNIRRQTFIELGWQGVVRLDSLIILGALQAIQKMEEFHEQFDNANRKFDFDQFSDAERPQRGMRMI